MGASAGGIKAGKAFVIIGAIDATTRVLNQVSAKLQAFSRTSVAIGKTLITGAAGAGLLFGVSLNTFKSFDDALRKLKAVTSGTDAEFAALADQAKLLGRTTSFTAQEVASLQVELGKAGFSRAEIENATESILNLARATDTEAATAAGIAASALRQFGLEASETARVADVLTATANGTFNTIEDLGEALKYAGPVAADLGITFEETNALLGALGNLGIQGSNAGTALRRLPIALAENESALSGLGVELSNVDGSMRPLIDVLGDLDDATADMTDVERLQTFSQLFGKLGITSASALSQSGLGVRKLVDELNNAQGTAAETSATMDEGLGGAWRRFMSAVEGVGIAIGEALAGPAGKLLDWLSDGINMVTDFVTANQWLTQAAAAVASAIAGIGVGFLALGGGASVMATVVSAVGVVASAISTVVGFIFTVGVPTILAIAAAVVGASVQFAILAAAIVGVGAVLVGGVVAFFRYTKAGKAMWTTLVAGFNWLKEKAIATFGGIYNALAAGNLSAAGRIAWLGLKLVFLQGAVAALDVWTNFIESMGKAWSSGLAGIWKMFTGFASQMAGGIGKLGKSMAALVAGQFQNASELANEVWNQELRLDDKNILAAYQKGDLKGFLTRLRDATEAELNDAIESVAKQKTAELFGNDEASDGSSGGSNGHRGEATGGRSDTALADTLSRAVAPLEKGSVAAMEKFLKNREGTIQQKQLGEQIKTNEQLGEINAKLDSSNGLSNAAGA